MRDNISIVGDSFSAVEGIQYIGGYLQYMREDNISTVGDNISTVEGIQYSGDTFSTVGVSFSTVRDNISTVEVIHYSGYKDLKYCKFLKNL